MPLKQARRGFTRRPLVAHQQFVLAKPFVHFKGVGSDVAQQVRIKPLRWRKAAETQRHEQPTTLTVDVIWVEPGLVYDHAEDLVA